jgi:hypothetical protein
MSHESFEPCDEPPVAHTAGEDHKPPLYEGVKMLREQEASAPDLARRVEELSSALRGLLDVQSHVPVATYDRAIAEARRVLAKGEK